MSNAFDFIPIQKQVNLTHLLYTYGIIPLVLILVWVDCSFFNKQWLHALPFRPESWLIWIYLFGLPHVFASFFTLADKEYLEFYKRKIIAVVVIFTLLPFFVNYFLGARIFFLIFTAFIVYHTIAQQFGIATAALKQKPTHWNTLWKWSAITLGMCLYLMLYTEPIPIALNLFDEKRHWLELIASVSLIINILSAMVLMWQANNRVGAAHVFANTVFIGSLLLLFMNDYFVLIVVVSRVIHEFSAWHIYSVHDSNRANIGKPNALIKAFRFIKAPVYVLSITLALLIGFLVTYGLMSFNLFVPFLVSVSLMHYYSESFLWKNGSIHRQHLSFKI